MVALRERRAKCEGAGSRRHGPEVDFGPGEENEAREVGGFGAAQSMLLFARSEPERVQDIPAPGSPKGADASRTTLVIPMDDEVLVVEHPLDGAVLPMDEAGARRRDTLPVPAPLPPSGDTRATLTLLTGLHAGRLLAIDGSTMIIGRAGDADVAVDDPGVSRRHARIARTPAGGFYVEDLGSTNGTFVGSRRIGVALLQPGDVLQLGPLRARFAIVDSVEETLYRQLYESSVRDPLTNVFNRKYFVARLLAEIARARRADGDVAVLMIDVDSLKRVNDSFGHLAGDRALCAVATRILRVLRVEDVLARYGGDEFVVLAAGTSPFDAERLGERVRRAVEGLLMSAQGREVGITTSIGVASLSELATDEEPVAGLLAMADARMYGAKESGKNKVCAAFVVPEAPTTPTTVTPIV
jgi:two-component system cell cycle response regulator